MEVIYTGLRKAPEVVVNALIQEDVDVVGISILSGAHMTLLPKFKKMLDEEGVNDVMLVAGGIIPEEDRIPLLELGYNAIFTPGTPITQIAQEIRDWISTSDRHKNRITTA